jgi:hypothetical protein
LVPLLAEIYLCGACSDHEIIRRTRSSSSRSPSPPSSPLSPAAEMVGAAGGDAGGAESSEGAVHSLEQQVSPFSTCIGSPCLRHCVHGAPIGAAAQQRGGAGAERAAAAAGALVRSLAVTAHAGRFHLGCGPC